MIPTNELPTQGHLYIEDSNGEKYNLRGNSEMLAAIAGLPTISSRSLISAPQSEVHVSTYCVS